MSGERHRILILDDEPLVTDSLVLLLESDPGWEAAAYQRPSEALQALESADPDVVLSDFLMPEMDGVAFLAEARRLRPHASRILLTGYADKENAIRAINEVGLYHYLEKPWDNAELLMILRNAAERSRLLRRLADALDRLQASDRSLEELRARLFKAIL